MEMRTKTTLELTEEERTALKNALNQYFSELRLEVAATKRGTGELKKEEELLKGIIGRL